MAPMPACPICKSKKWHKERHSGDIRCSQGHILQGYRNESHEAGEFGPHAMRKRTLKSTRVKGKKKSLANPILYHGERARYHYFQCLQVLLRMQIQKLTELWNLPSEFEIICRDTWALHLSFLPSPPPPEPFLHSQEQSGSQQANLSGKEKESEKKQTEEGQRDDEDKSVSEPSDTDSSSSPDDEGEDEADPGIDEFLREASEAESSEAGGEEHGQPSQGKGASRKPKRRWRGDDSPAATICVLIHSCWLMRIPVMYKDLVNLIETYTLPYLDPVRLLPLSLTRHLTKHAKQALSPHYAPTPIFLHTITSRLSKLCFERYGIFTPELNASPILWRTVHYMGGTHLAYGVMNTSDLATFYTISKLLARHLELPLTLNPAMAPPVLNMVNKDPTSHKSDNVPSEVALVATVVIPLKMIYGLDGKEVYPREDWDPAYTMPALEVYMKHLRAMITSDIKTSREHFSPSSMAGVQDEDEQSLDAYLDFCERALLDRNGRDNKAGNNDLVAEYFPLRRSMEADEQAGTVLNVTQGADGHGGGNDVDRPVLAAVQAASGESKSNVNMVRPGESYAIYSAHDVFGRLPDNYAIVLSRAARWTAVSEDYLSAVVERFERRLVRLWKRRQRRSGMNREAEEERADSSDEQQ